MREGFGGEIYPGFHPGDAEKKAEEKRKEILEEAATRPGLSPGERTEGALEEARKIEGGPERDPEKREPPPGGDIEASRVTEMFEKFKEIAEATNEANEKLAEYAEHEPRIKEVLETPQSRDKHGEGPKVADHYREILTSLALMREGNLDFETMKGVLDLPEGMEDQWGKMVEVVKAHPKLFEAAVMAHDLGKAETVGFVSAKPELGFPDKKAAMKEDEATKESKRPERLAKYRELFDSFSAAHPELSDDGLAQAFQNEDGISITYYGHAEKATTNPENRAVVDRMAENLGLTEEEKGLLIFAVEQHMNPLTKFDKAGEPKDFEFFLKKAEEAKVNPEKAMQIFEAIVLLDGVLGTRKADLDNPELLVLNGVPLRKFLEAEQKYPAYRAEQEGKAREAEKARRAKEALVKAGLGGDDLQQLLGMKPGKELGKVIKNIERAAAEGAPLEGVPEDKRTEIETRIAAAREELAKSA